VCFRIAAGFKVEGRAILGVRCQVSTAVCVREQWRTLNLSANEYYYYFSVTTVVELRRWAESKTRDVSGLGSEPKYNKPCARRAVLQVF
jgi:hypothetical protein